MKEIFKTATIIPLRLDPFIQAILDERRFKPNYAVRNLISKYTPDEGNKKTIYDAITYIIDTSFLIDRHAKEYFFYRNGKAPESVYYLTIAGSFIDRHPEVFPNLPADYKDIAKDFERIVRNPDQIDSSYISGAAKFCYRIHTLSVLSDFLDQLRQGQADLSNPHTKEIYDRLVIPAFDLTGNEDMLAIEISESIKKINFVLNHHDNDFCDYVSLGMKGVDTDFGRAELWDLLPVPTSEGRKVFDICYSALSDLHGSESHDFYYDFAERILAPANLLAVVCPDINPLCFDYMMAYATVVACNDPSLVKEFGTDLELLLGASIDQPERVAFLELGIEEKDTLAMSACLAISDMTYSGMKIGGPNVTPLYDGDDVVALHEKLSDSSDFEIRDGHLSQIWDKCRQNAVSHIRDFTKQFPQAAEELGLHPAIY